MKLMSSAQRAVLREINSHRLFPGYCELMLQTGLKSYKAVDWVCDALVRRGYATHGQDGPEITDAGRAALSGVKIVDEVTSKEDMDAVWRRVADRESA